MRRGDRRMRARRRAGARALQDQSDNPPLANQVVQGHAGSLGESVASADGDAQRSLRKNLDLDGRFAVIWLRVGCHVGEQGEVDAARAQRSEEVRAGALAT